MSSPAQPQRGHIPCLDGIRAVSIGIVFIAHAGLQDVVPGGFGVTVFFFLSGFLITTLLRREFESRGTIGFGNFYIRRALRIFPPFYGALGLALLLGALGLIHGKPDALGVGLIAAHLGNYAQIFWPEVRLPAGTGVYWSLAVEEHFYLVFPAIALTLLRWRNRGLSVGLLLAAAAGILAWRVHLVGSGAHEYRTYLATDTRFDSILFGCILALGMNPAMDPPLERRPALEFSALFVSGLVLLYCFVHRDPTFRETYRYTLQGLALMPIFYLAVRNPGWALFRWLELAPLKYLGLLSYTLYLVHYLAIDSVAFLLPELPKLVRGLLSAVLSLALASASYHLMEAPLAQLRKRYHGGAPT